MIPVKGYKGQRVAVLGLGRSGLATAEALRAGGAEPLLWDDSPEARAKAEAAGLTVMSIADATKAADVIIETVEAQAPGFRASILGRQVLSPRGLERKFGLAGARPAGQAGQDQPLAARQSELAHAPVEDRAHQARHV